MATGANTTGKIRGTGRSSKGNQATDDEMLTEVKKEDDEFSVGEDDIGEDDKKDFVLDEDKITREEFERAMSSQEYPKDATN
jgi:hypothetical protein